VTAFTGIILAGGKSLRLGENKAFIELGGKPMIMWVLDAFMDLFDEIFISANEPELFSSLPVQVVPDAVPGGGALMGLYSSLKEMRNEFAFVAACDMPFISKGLVSYMLNNARDCDALVPRIDSYIDPLHAVYSKSCREAIKRRIDIGDRQVRSFYGDINVKYADKEIIYKFDPSGLSLFNINNAVDMKKARSLISSRQAAQNETGRIRHR